MEHFVTALHHGRVPRDLAAALPEGPSPAHRAALAEAVARLDALACTTIHGFCRMLLTPWPVEARIDPGATIADEAEANLLFDDTLQVVLRERLTADTAAEDALAALFVLGEEKPEGLIAELAGTLRQHRGSALPPAPDLRTAWAALQEAVADLRAFVGGAASLRARHRGNRRWAGGDAGRVAGGQRRDGPAARAAATSGAGDLLHEARRLRDVSQEGSMGGRAARSREQGRGRPSERRGQCPL